MKLFTTATLNWFNDACCDARYLDVWDRVPLSYTPGQVIDDSWHIDHYEERITADERGKLFRRAADLLMRYQFYPPTLLTPVSDFSIQRRWMQIGDRIVQRIHLFRPFQTPILDVITMNEVVRVIQEPCRYGFTYATTVSHVEQGEWSAQLEWRESGDLVLHVTSISRPAPDEPSYLFRFMRKMQKRAHQMGITYFKQAVLATTSLP